MTLHPDGTVTGGAPIADAIRAEKFRKRASEYAKRYAEALFSGKLDPPGAGDCFLCCGIFGDGPDAAHILSHLSERYYVPRLVENAVQRFPVSPSARDFLSACWIAKNPSHAQHADAVKMLAGGRGADISKEQIRKSVKRFVLEQVGQASYNERGHERRHA